MRRCDVRPSTTPRWREYSIEAALLGLFMVSACAFTTLLQHPSSVVRHAITVDWHRRALLGLAMGWTAVALIYSPWGRRSGAHFNPSSTLTFLRLGKIAPRDAAGYVIAQFVGAVAGVLVAVAVLGMRVMDPEVAYVTTMPGVAGVGVAFVAEVVLTFGLMSVVLAVSSVPRWQRFTGMCVGVLVALYITVEAPLSGMSMNPARSFGPALVSGRWSGLWVYFLAPPLGMLLAAQLHLKLRGRVDALCAKMRHVPGEPCLFCEYRRQRDAAAAARAPDVGTIRESAYF